MKTIVYAFCTAGLLGAGAAAAQNLVATDPAAVMAAMQNAGFLAKLETDSVGDPKISSKVSHSDFSVYFYGCEGGKDCTTVQFSSGYDLTNPLNAGKMNQWNRENRFARAYIDDEGDPFIKMDVVMRYDGYGPENFAYTLDLWRLLIEDFEEYINW